MHINIHIKYGVTEDSTNYVAGLRMLNEKDYHLIDTFLICVPFYTLTYAALYWPFWGCGTDEASLLG